MTRRQLLTASAALLPAAHLSRADAAVDSPSVAALWNRTLLDAISRSRLGPPMTARAIGIVHTCVFDAWAAYDAVAVGTVAGGALRRPLSERTLANKSEAVSFAAYRTLCDLFPALTPTFRERMVALGYDPNEGSRSTSRPCGIANLCADAILAFRHADGANQENGYADTTGYVPVNTPDLVVDPSRWQQLRFANGASPSYIAPHWGAVRPFALPSGDALRPPAPPAFGSGRYEEEAREVVHLIGRLTDTEKAIAEYWADGPRTVLPPGHWCLFADWVSRRDRLGLDDDVRLLFLMGNAVMDAGIATWDAKRAWDTSRPITAIRHLYRGQRIPSFLGPNLGIGLAPGEQWMPYQSPNFVTPPFPEYTSGHSAFSAAGAEILKRFTGSERFGLTVTIPAGTSGFEAGVPARDVLLHLPTFGYAADQAGTSRRLGGIHFRSGDMAARALGKAVGKAVWDRGMAYLTGRA